MKWERVKVNESRILTRKREGENEQEKVIFALKKRVYQKERESARKEIPLGEVGGTMSG